MRNVKLIDEEPEIPQRTMFTMSDVSKMPRNEHTSLCPFLYCRPLLSSDCTPAGDLPHGGAKANSRENSCGGAGTARIQHPAAYTCDCTGADRPLQTVFLIDQATFSDCAGILDNARAAVTMSRDMGVS